eukprot:TRINITY_DN4030_c0_g1_i1.p2 TRINITY_DN4030_c0_g1~~TRINITY_DN4030_c0_g1_i1.p2  ORF type:complete len:54 (-),score=10.69 TRINITY_DN4030_c0_g1_i1:216-377(-)
MGKAKTMPSDQAVNEKRQKQNKAQNQNLKSAVSKTNVPVKEQMKSKNHASHKK